MNKNDLKNTQIADIIANATFVWGSFQYDDVAALYMKLCKVEEELGREVAIASLLLIHQFGLKVGPVVPFEGDILAVFKEALSVDIVDPEVVGDDTTEIRKTFEHIKTVTEALNFLREQSWDLWCGVPYIGKMVFPEITMSLACPSHAAGIMCWLLKSYGFVENDEPFKEWDT